MDILYWVGTVFGAVLLFGQFDPPEDTPAWKRALSFVIALVVVSFAMRLFMDFWIGPPCPTGCPL